MARGFSANESKALGSSYKPKQIYNEEYKTIEVRMPSIVRAFWEEVGKSLEDPDVFREKDHGNWTIKAFVKEPTKQQAQRELGYYIAEMKSNEDNRLSKVEKLTAKQKAELGELLARAAAVQGLEMDKDVSMGPSKIPFTDEDLKTEGIPFRYPGVEGWQSDVLNFYLKLNSPEVKNFKAMEKQRAAWGLSMARVQGQIGLLQNSQGKMLTEGAEHAYDVVSQLNQGDATQARLIFEKLKGAYEDWKTTVPNGGGIKANGEWKELIRLTEKALSEGEKLKKMRVASYESKKNKSK